jgi:signal transduction histidine kinase
MSRPLALRIAMPMAVALLVCIGGAGFGLRHALHDTIDAGIEARLDARLAALAGAIEADEDELELKDSGFALSGLAESWAISTSSGRILWSDGLPSLPEPKAAREQTITLGEHADAPLWSDDQLSLRSEGHDGHHDSAHSLRMIRYHLPNEHGRLDLVLSAQTTISSDLAAKARIDVVLAIGLPLLWAALAGFLVAILRHHLRPLTQLAGQAAIIAPETLDQRLRVRSGTLEYDALAGTLNAMLDRLSAGMQRERQFASAAAHELRTPLAQLRTDLEVSLRRTRSSDEYLATLNACHSDTLRLEALVAALLDWTRARGARITETTTWRDVRTLLTAHLPDLTVPIMEQLDQQPIIGTAPLITAILRNLCDNAARYAPGTAIDLSVASRDQGLTIQVSDQGPGIPSADRERIFSPLVRLDQARTIADHAHGFGLGLSIARDLARACGGDLVCRAREDHQSGAVFDLWLPSSPVTTGAAS